MSRFRIKLFGSFRATYDGEPLDDWGSSKAEELLCYLLLNRERPHSRELLASALWEYATTGQSKAYLRKALWQVQGVLKSRPDLTELQVLIPSAESIQCNPDVDLWLDVEAFESAYELAKGIPGPELDETRAASLHNAVNLYEGDLLEDCYWEWCLQDRERFRHLFLSILDKLASHCASNRKYEAGMSYAERSLSVDPARESTHRQLMRLRYLFGDRTGAARQYESCVRTLREELDMKPAEATVRLYEEIRAGGGAVGYSDALPTSSEPPKSAYDLLNQLKAAVNLLAEANDRVRKEIATLEERILSAEP